MDIELILTKLLETGMTQSQIAGEIGCSQPTVSEMASGKVGKSRPSWKIVDGIKRLAEKKGVTLSQQKVST